uniref:Uncharacterized protein n=1 Tax=Rhizophagus irregularis (strain DAOM 181602 / DAOM 197198 / MUCL 43194) TaxID=747089 RepID=U9U7T7_RHIID
MKSFNPNSKNGQMIKSFPMINFYRFPKFCWIIHYHTVIVIMDHLLLIREFPIIGKM